MFPLRWLLEVLFHSFSISILHRIIVRMSKIVPHFQFCNYIKFDLVFFLIFGTTFSVLFNFATKGLLLWTNAFLFIILSTYYISFYLLEFEHFVQATIFCKITMQNSMNCTFLMIARFWFRWIGLKMQNEASSNSDVN